MKNASLRTTMVVVCAMLGACAVGPDFVRPSAPQASGFLPSRLESEAPGSDASAQKFSSDEVPGRWWTLFGNPELDALVDAALVAHPSIQTAEAALKAADELRKAQEGAYYPNVQASLNPTRQKISSALSSPSSSNATLYNLHTTQISVGLVPDIFGGNRRQVESLAATAEYQFHMLQAARQALAANLVTSAIQEAALRAQLDATRSAIDTGREQLGLAREQARLGAIAEIGVVAQEAALAQIEASLPPLQKQLALQRDLIAQLSGRLPSDPPGATFAFDSIHMPKSLPSSLPSALVEHRPDIRAAEAQWHSANAQIGVARAARFPQVMLTGSWGGIGSFAALPAGDAAFWNLGANIVQPIFAGGQLMYRERAAEALQQQSAAQYRATVLNAFQNVADVLQALQSDSTGLAVALRAEQAAEQSMKLARAQVRFGELSYLNTLNAQQTWQQAVATRIQARATQLGDVAALCLALGGGWWQPDVAASPGKEGSGREKG